MPVLEGYSKWLKTVGLPVNTKLVRAEDVYLNPSAAYTMLAQLDRFYVHGLVNDEHYLSFISPVMEIGSWSDLSAAGLGSVELWSSIYDGDEVDPTTAASLISDVLLSAAQTYEHLKTDFPRMFAREGRLEQLTCNLISSRNRQRNTVYSVSEAADILAELEDEWEDT